MEKKEFKSESKRLLDLMINSIYTHKEIFLRELISNASDAIDKLCYMSLTDNNVPYSRDDFKIVISRDEETRTLTISDNGVGMTQDELEENLGVIAKSGSLQFKQELETKPDDLDIIGQFGVGFYSAFMIAESVTVISRAYGAPSAYKWYSEGADGYEIEPCDKDSVGTDIIIKVKEDSEENFSDYLQEHTLHSIIKKYSDYVRWPIMMEVTKSRKVEEPDPSDEGKPKVSWEDYTELDIINSRIPIWQRAKSEVSDSECADFYKEKFLDYTDPVSVIRISAEGTVSYKAMLFIPGAAPLNYFTRDYDAGLTLYTSGVMIMERCADLLPDHFRFVRGIVDSQDLSLNISRELLQHDRQLKVIAANVEKKIKAELKRMLENDREKYLTFYKSFGLQLKYGIVNGYGVNRDLLSDLLMFASSKSDALVTLSEYVKNMQEDQKHIYYACGGNLALLEKLPQAEKLRDRGIEILYLTDDVDEFAVKMLHKYEEKEFCSVVDAELDIGDKEESERQESENKSLLEFVKSTLGDKIAKAIISSKLISHPACLSAQGEISLEMERYFKSMQNLPGEHMRAQRVLELNATHPVFNALRIAVESDTEKATRYVKMLYGISLLTAGFELDDTPEFTELLTSLMI